MIKINIDRTTDRYKDFENRYLKTIAVFLIKKIEKKKKLNIEKNIKDLSPFDLFENACFKIQKVKNDSLRKVRSSKLARWLIETILTDNPENVIILYPKNKIPYMKKMVKMFDWNSFLKCKSINGILNKNLIIEYIQLTEVSVCPYCNRNYSSVIKVSKDQNYLPDIDHFYPKNKYPFLSFSLANLIPSCSVCNERYKLDKDTFNDNKLINPYVDSFDNLSVFFEIKDSNNCILKIIEFLTGSCIKPKISIVFNGVEKLSESNKFKVDKNIDTFHLKEIYNQVHLADAYDMLYKLVRIRKNSVTSYREILKEAQKVQSIQEVDDNLSFLFFGRCLDSRFDLKEPLAKLRRDIFNQFRSY